MPVLDSIFRPLLSWQRGVHGVLAQALGAESALPLSVLGWALLLGAIHALTPGHGKAVLALYVLGGPVRPWRALRLGVTAATLHILITVALFVAVFWGLVHATGLRPAEAPALQAAGQGLVALIGAWLTLRSLRAVVRAARRGPAGEDHVAPGHGGGSDRWMALAAGMTPCPLTLAMLIYAAHRGLLVSAVLVTVGMIGGVAFTLSLTALAAALFRGPLEPLRRRFPAAGHWIAGGLGVGSGLVLLALGFSGAMAAISPLD